MIQNLRRTDGNIVIVVTGIVFFFLVMIQGAAEIITDAVVTSGKIGGANRAYYTAEAALETALFEQSGHSIGWQKTDGVADLININNTVGAWSTLGQAELTRLQTTSGLDTIYLPAQQNTSNEYDLTNWATVDFGEQVTFEIFTDDSTGVCNLPLGSGGARDCIGYTEPSFAHDSGIDADDTNTIVGDNYPGVDENSNISEIFFELFLPGVDDLTSTDTDILLSWQTQGLTHPDESSFPEVMSLQARDECSGAEIGSICVGHFTQNITDAKVAYEEVGGGLLVRLEEPVGLIRAQTDTNYFYPVNIHDFYDRSFTYSDENITETVNGYSLFFPEIQIQLGDAPLADIDGDTVYVTTGYARVGFVNASSNFADFQISDTTAKIEASATSGAAQQMIEATLVTGQTAPFFNFAVFQQ